MLCHELSPREDMGLGVGRKLFKLTKQHTLRFPGNTCPNLLSLTFGLMSIKLSEVVFPSSEFQSNSFQPSPALASIVHIFIVVVSR